MEEGPHAHAHAPHGTGRRWLDISLVLSAFFVSLVSLFLAIHNGRTMERLVAANSYPNLDFVQGNMLDLHDGQGLRPVLHLALANTGIGPARLRGVELSFAGKLQANLRELLATCCTPGSAESLPHTSYWYPGEVRGVMLQAGKELDLFAWPEARDDPRWARLREHMGEIGARVCYCSVFDECYLADRAQREPSRVRACPVMATPYRGD
jgi:hypothetical protein